MTTKRDSRFPDSRKKIIDLTYLEMINIIFKVTDVKSSDDTRTKVKKSYYITILQPLYTDLIKFAGALRSSDNDSFNHFFCTNFSKLNRTLSDRAVANALKVSELDHSNGVKLIAFILSHTLYISDNLTGSNKILDQIDTICEKYCKEPLDNGYGRFTLCEKMSVYHKNYKTYYNRSHNSTLRTSLPKLVMTRESAKTNTKKSVAPKVTNISEKPKHVPVAKNDPKCTVATPKVPQKISWADITETKYSDATPPPPKMILKNPSRTVTHAATNQSFTKTIKSIHRPCSLIEIPDNSYYNARSQGIFLDCSNGDDTTLISKLIAKDLKIYGDEVTTKSIKPYESMNGFLIMDGTLYKKSSEDSDIFVLYDIERQSLPDSKDTVETKQPSPITVVPDRSYYSKRFGTIVSQVNHPTEKDTYIIKKLNKCINVTPKYATKTIGCDEDMKGFLMINNILYKKTNKNDAEYSQYKITGL